MNSKKIFSWSRRQSNSDLYHRTGGLLPIDTSGVVSNGSEAKTITKTGKMRPSNLRIMLPEKKQIAFSPVAPSYNAALAHAASNLQAAFDEILRSPASIYTPCIKSPLLEKPLPSPPQNISTSPNGDLPAELPGSLLLENQGFPCTQSPVQIAKTSPESRDNTREEQHLEDHSERTNISPCSPGLVQKALIHAKSVPNLSMRRENMSSTHSLKTLDCSPITELTPLQAHHKKSLSATSSRRNSGHQIITKSTDGKHTGSDSVNADGSNVSCKIHVDIGDWMQPLSPVVGRALQTDVGACVGHSNKLSASPTTISTTSHGIHPDGQNATIKKEESAISTIQAQPGNRRISNGAYIANLFDSYSIEAKSLKNLFGELDKQSTESPNLHHASGNNLSSPLYTPPYFTSHGSSRNTVDGWSPSSSVYSQNVFEQHQSSQEQRRNPEMESLKRKLSATRRSEPYRNLLPELNQYKQNNAALQKQIESLMAKLNMSKQNEKALRAMVDRADQKSDEWKDAAGRADKLAKNVKGLQNTVDHLEHRLEIANMERLDAQEELFNTRAKHSPFDIVLSKIHAINDKEQKGAHEAHGRRKSVFAFESPIDQEVKPQDLLTISAFIARIERLQEQIRQKDAHIAQLNLDRDKSRLKHDVLMQEYQDVALQLDIQNQLLRRTQSTDTQVDQLRSAMIDRDAIIQEKEASMCAIERQLEHHKLLLQAEIRRHATLKIHDAVENDPLPELTSLAAKADIDKWISQLNHRLKKERKLNDQVDPANKLEAEMERMRQEIDFYIREIIYFKLDIKGYKSDIRRLKRTTAHMGNCGTDLQFDVPMPKPSTMLFVTAQPNLSTPETTTPIETRPVSKPSLVRRPNTPPPADSAIEFCFSPIDRNLTNIQFPQQLDLDANTTAQALAAQKAELNPGKQTRKLDPTIPTRSIARLSLDCRQPMPQSPSSPSAIPPKSDTPRSVSDSIIQLYMTPKTPKMAAGLYSPIQTDTSAEAIKFSSHEHPVHIAPHVKFTSARPVSVESASQIRNSRGPTKKEDQLPYSTGSRSHSGNASGGSIIPTSPGPTMSNTGNEEPHKIRHDSGMGSSPLTGNGGPSGGDMYKRHTASLIGKAF